MAWISVADVDLSGRRVLVRCDFNAPVPSGYGSGSKLLRPMASLQSYVARGASLILLSHLGRPRFFDTSLSLRGVADYLRVHGLPQLQFVSTVTDDSVRAVTENLSRGSVVLLENLRFDKGEERNDMAFAEAIAFATGADMYVNDAFACVHRTHASVVALAQILPSYAGLLLVEEVQALRSVLDGTQQPMGAIIGGSKISTKLRVVLNLVRKMDFVVIGGAMANTFLADMGFEVGESLYERDHRAAAAAVKEVARQCGCRLVLPTDVRVLRADGTHRVVPSDSVAENDTILDLGDKSIALIQDVLAEAAAVIWNGPLGAFETQPFDTATRAVMSFVRTRTKDGRLVSVIGGGDTLAAAAWDKHEEDDFSLGFGYASTGGGAFLEWCEGKTLPGLEALNRTD